MSVTAEQVQELMGDHSSQYPSPTDPYVWITEYDYQAIADELNAAMVGRGTCHDKGNIERFICSECGCRLDLQDDDWEATMWLDEAAMVPNYCPNCGRRVVDE